jgi:DNA polymerase-1
MPFSTSCEACPALPGARVSGTWWGDVDWSGPSCMAVGINPGWHEEQEGQPFVGPSGALLKAGLAQAGVRRAFLTNTYRCAGEPDASFARACASSLEEEIERVKPAFILALGNIAVQRLLGKGTVGQVSGKEIWSAKYKAWVLPAFHPAAILRDRGRENAWRADVYRFGRLARGDLVPPPNTPPVRVDLISSGSGLRVLDTALRTEPAFSYDFETNVTPGWWHKDFKAYSIAFSFTGGEAMCLPIAHPDVSPEWTALALKWMERVTPVLRGEGDGRRTSRTVHNGMFDDLVWFRLTGSLSRPTADTMLMLQLLDENAPKSLKWAGRAHLGWPDWDIDARKEHALNDLYPYNGYDAAATILLREILLDRMQEDPAVWHYFRRLEMPMLRALQKLVARGIYVDRSTAARLMKQAWREQQAADARLPEINPASPRQVAQWLYQDMKLPVIKNGKQHPSTDEATIKTLALEHPVARLILAARKPRKKISTYFKPIRRMTKHSFDGRLHPDMRTTSVETGRLAGFIHTTPRDSSVRPVYTARPGMVLLQADYRQIEARICAWMAAGRPETWDGISQASMLWAFHVGTDIYIDFAARALRKDARAVTKEERQILGKVPVLAQLYGISWQGLREYAWKTFEIAWSPAQAQALWQLFRRRYPEFPAWHRIAEAKLIRRGWVQTPIGRIRRLPSAMSGQKDAIRAGINAEPQSLASDITQQALILLDRMGARIVGDIHDALLIEVRADRLAGSAQAVRSAMLEAPIELRKLGLWLPEGLIDVEITAGPWGLGKEIKPAKA